MSLSKTQKRLVAELEAGQKLVRSFDVYGGWWWWLRPTQTKVNARTAERLLADGVVVAGKEERIYSGYREMVCALAKAPESPADERDGCGSE
jgi:hypothetical protein